MATSLKFALLGTVSFEVLSLIGLEASSQYEFAEHKVIEGKPKLQWTGDALDAYTVRLRFHRRFCDPDERLQALKEAAARHEALPFTLANGSYQGRFVIEEVTQGPTETFGDGTTLSMEVSVKLREWVEDIALSSRTGARQKPSGGVKKSETYRTQEYANKDSYSYTKIVRKE